DNVRDETSIDLEHAERRLVDAFGVGDCEVPVVVTRALDKCIEIHPRQNIGVHEQEELAGPDSMSQQRQGSGRAQGLFLVHVRYVDAKFRSVTAERVYELRLIPRGQYDLANICVAQLFDDDLEDGRFTYGQQRLRDGERKGPQPRSQATHEQ